jgi:hypothetical protein
VEAHADVQALQEPPVEAGPIFTESVARINIRDKTPVSIQMPDLELIAEQVEVSLREVE